MKAKDLTPGLYWDITGNDGPTVVSITNWGDGDKMELGIGDELGCTLKAETEVWHLRRLEVPSLEWIMGLPIDDQ